MCAHKELILSEEEQGRGENTIFSLTRTFR